MVSKNPLQYLHPNCTLTLREGIAELRAAEGVENDAVENVAKDLVADLNVHDAIHVLFACPTNLNGEISAHVWTIFGTTLSMKDMHRVNMHDDHRQVLAEIGHRKLILRWFRSLPNIAMTFYRTRRMKKRWPADGFLAYLDVPLSDLRSQFGIRLPNAIQSEKEETHNSGAAVRNVRSRRNYATTIG
jgi:hypothetical protein